mmetsp:Transcript_2136/g.4620  ORF Transcript_2136/g.4620 Transcript_2136/m.4620 type:complete len:84 (+) Transcript_2136:84-335(+)
MGEEDGQAQPEQPSTDPQGDGTQEVLDEFRARVHLLHKQKHMLMEHIAAAAKQLNAALAENQILKDELHALGMTPGTPEDGQR